MVEKPDIKKIGLGLAEDTAQSVIDKIVKPYAEYYAAEKGGAIGAAILPFIDDVLDYVNREFVDKIDGEVG